MKKHIFFVLAIFLMLLSPARAELFTYDADFNSEALGALTTIPTTNPLPLYLPTNIIRGSGCSVDVVASAGNLLDKPVLLDSAPGGLASAAFYNPSRYTSGIWHISWDSLVLNMPVDSTSEQGQVSIGNIDASGSGTAPWGLKYNIDGTFLISDMTGFHSIGTFSVGISDHFDLHLNLDTDSYELAINSQGVLTGNLIETDNFAFTYFRSYARGYSYDVAPFAFDNLKVISIPEPTTLSLLTLGAMLVGRRRRA